MGGGDKFLKPFGQSTLLGHILKAAKAQVSPVILNMNGDPGRVADYDLPILSDQAPEHFGPLAGVCAGLVHAQSLGATQIVTFACDVPFFPNDYVSRLCKSKQQTNADVVYARSNGRDHPVMALWSVDMLERLRERLDQKHYKLLDWFKDINAVSVEWPVTDVDPFMNINTPEDLEKAQSLIVSRGSQ